MAVPESVERVITEARRRLSVAGLVRRLVGWTGAAVALAAGLAAASRVWVLEWADVTVAMLIAGALIGSLVWSLVGRPSRQRAALAVDRRLGGYDRVSTALEIGRKEAPTELEERQIRSAAAWAQARDISPVASLLPDRHALGLAVLAVVVLAGLILVPAATDVALAQRQADRDAIAAEADRLQEVAAEAPPEVADRLEDLIEELRNAEDLQEALDSIQKVSELHVGC